MWAVFGFNLGVEICQLLVVAVCLPLIHMSLKHKCFNKVKLVSACATLLLSCFWVYQRSTFIIPLA